MISAVAGFLAGLSHVLSGADHLTAIAPLSVQKQSRGWLTGLRWGVGHAAGVLVVGMLLILLRETLPLNFISSWSERLVGVMLIGIGFWALRKAFSKQLHRHEHTHEGETHVHLHFHSTEQTHGKTTSHFHTHAAFGIGTLHGLAGSAHFFGVLPALAFPSQIEAVIYLLAFAVGTVLAMAGFSSLLAWMAGRFVFRGMRAYRTLLAGTGAAAFIAGGYWLVG